MNSSGDKKDKTTITSLNSLLVVDKERDWTSHDVVARMRGIIGQRRIGHTGSLDPAATGVMLLCLGQATRLVEYMVHSKKCYEGEIVLGITTDTDDAEGVPIKTNSVPGMEENLDLEKICSKFLGTIQQVPPIYSAVKIRGQRAYSIARSGRKPDLQSRTVSIYELTLIRKCFNRLSIFVTCGPGMYVRSLARDIGTAIGTGGHLSSLRRVTNGSFNVEDAHTISEIENLMNQGRIGEVLIDLDKGILNLETLVVAMPEAKKIRNGQSIAHPAALSEIPKIMRCYDEEDRFLGIVQSRDDGFIYPKKILSV